MAEQLRHARQLLRPSETAASIGMSKAQVYRLRKTDPTFPKLIKLGVRSSAFDADELSAWIEARSAASNGESV